MFYIKEIVDVDTNEIRRRSGICLCMSLSVRRDEKQVKEKSDENNKIRWSHTIDCMLSVSSISCIITLNHSSASEFTP